LAFANYNEALFDLSTCVEVCYHFGPKIYQHCIPFKFLKAHVHTAQKEDA
jgi:hypothetical protein